MSTPPEKLCADLPKEFKAYFEEVRDLSFAQTPNYYGFSRLFITCMQRHGLKTDLNDFLWNYPRPLHKMRDDLK